ncbi:IDEAL domain-containing protein [Thalassobacillus hwangdonensis]|uniref:IDEAL domain-containing protein n=1 Tax=Thalassobacillus hwangdonensis TaxID=546108 RepID=A0ABW3L6R5_9BACI
MTVKMLKPYYVKEDSHYTRIVLAYQYFSVLVDGQLYHFIPKESKEIIIDRKKNRIHNVYDIFVFQRGKKVIYVAVADLLVLPEFMTQIQSILKTHDRIEEKEEDPSESIGLFEELEKGNLRRLIDKAIDNGDEVLFNQLTQKLNQTIRS